jgi:molybdenum cofactor cytidylyltransferase
MKITGVLLAAGTSSRLGSRNKLLLKYNNRTVIEVSVQQLTNSHVDDVVIVTGFERDRIENQLVGCLTLRMRLLYNSRYHLGRAESIKCAVKNIAGKADAALFMVADKPGVSTALINKAIDRYRKDRPTILYVETPAGRGHPIIFSKAVFNDLLSLKGDCVGNELIMKYESNAVKMKDRTVQVDIDEEADYRRLLEGEAGRRVS